MENKNNKSKPNVKVGLFSKLSTFFVRKFDGFILKYFTVRRPSGKLKYIWHTRQFKETANFHIPRLCFLGIVCFLCWKIKEKVKTLKGCSQTNYQLKSQREELVDKQEEVRKLFSFHF